MVHPTMKDNTAATNSTRDLVRGNLVVKGGVAIWLLGMTERQKLARECVQKEYKNC